MLPALLSLVLLASAALGFHVFSVAPARAENRAFAAFCWLLALWVVNDLVFWGFHGPNEDGQLWARVAFLLAIGIQCAFLAFTWVFPKQRDIPWRKLPWLGLPILFCVVMVLSGQTIGEVGFKDNVFHIQFKPGTFIVGAIIYFYFYLGRRQLIQSRAETQNIETRFQIDTLLLAAATTGVLTNLLGAVLPLMGVTKFLPFFSVGILLGCLVHAYAVLNFRLFQPASILDRLRLFPVTAKLSLSISATCLATVALVLAIARGFVGPGNWKSAIVFGLLAASAPAMALIVFVQAVVTRPLRQLSEAALKVAQGQTDVRVELETHDEVAFLASSFNDMVRQLEQDMESLRRLHEGLLRSERLATAGVLAAGAAHEINNPLAAVSSLVQMVHGKLDDSKQKRRLEQALEQIDRVAAATQDLMSLARPRPSAETLGSVHEVIDKVLRLLHYDKRFRRHQVKYQAKPELPQLLMDSDRIQQVLMNLLINARDALAEQPGVIEIHTDRDDDHLRVRIKDNGPGISKDDQARIFEPFYSTKAPGAGTGLGLSVCRDIIQSHGGHLKIDSESGQGAEFTILLPWTAASEPTQETTE